MEQTNLRSNHATGGKVKKKIVFIGWAILAFIGWAIVAGGTAGAQTTRCAPSSSFSDAIYFPFSYSQDGPGYIMLGANGSVFGFGDTPFLLADTADVVTIKASTDNDSYYILHCDGTVVNVGGPNYGSPSLSDLDPGETFSTMSPIEGGYWVFTNKGRAIAFGAARDYGDMSGVPLNGPVVDSVATPSGRGYWMLGSDGGVFSFGDARFYGSTGSFTLAAPVVGMIPDPDGVGYWLIASDGGVFAFEADFAGSMGGTKLNRPVIGGLSYGDAYLMVASDGGIFNFSNLPFLGSLPGVNRNFPYDIVGVAVFE